MTEPIDLTLHNAGETQEWRDEIFTLRARIKQLEQQLDQKIWAPLENYLSTKDELASIIATEILSKYEITRRA